MSTHRDRDQKIDANLRRIARHVQLPDLPADGSGWPRLSRGAAAAAAPPRAFGGANWWRQHPRLLTAAGSAAAAAIALAAFLFVTPGGAVHAATILRSFQASLADGFTLSYENLGAEGVRIDGQMLVLLDEPAADPLAPQAGNMSALYLEARIVADETAGEAAGLDLTTALTFSQQQQWVYLRADGLAVGLLDENPMLRALLPYVQQGVLLKLDGVFDMLSTELPRLGELLAPTDEADEKLLVSLKISGDGQPPGDETGGGSLTLRQQSPLDEAPPRTIDRQTGKQISRLVEALIQGQATPADLEALVTFIEEAAQRVEVIEVEPGLYILTAAEFAAPPGDPGAEWIALIEVQVAYRAQSGIEWARVDHVGPYDGTIRIDPAGEPDRERLNMERWIEPGTTLVLDLGAFAPMFQAVSEPEP